MTVPLIQVVQFSVGDMTVVMVHCLVHQAVVLFKLQLEVLTAVELTLMVQFSVGEMIVKVKVLLRVVHSFRFLLGGITTVPLIQVVQFSVGVLILMVKVVLPNVTHPVPLKPMTTIVMDLLHLKIVTTQIPQP